MEKDFVEECWFVYGFRIGRHYFGVIRHNSTGTATGVDFDWHKALTPFLLGWYHSHPGTDFLTPSDIDNRTMRSWVKGLGRSMLCGIFCEGKQQCYCYYKDGMDEKKESIIRRVPIKGTVDGPFFFGVLEREWYGRNFI